MINDAQLHLVLNHAPLFFIFFGVTALLGGLWRPSSDWRVVGLLLLLAAAVLTYFTIETGEGAEDIVEKLPGVAESFIEEHEEAAEVASVLVWILAGVSVLTLASVAVGSRVATLLVVISALGGLATLGSLIWTAHLGGLIRHTEIRQSGDSMPAEEKE